MAFRIPKTHQEKVAGALYSMADEIIRTLHQDGFSPNVRTFIDLPSDTRNDILRRLLDLLTNY